jgi:CheY-like chemotaxis protein
MSRILLAEDDRVSRVMLQAVLTKWGHEVKAAADGVEAFDRLSDPAGPNLAILDWMMPGMTGLDVCRRLRAIPDIRPIHIILLTARSKGSDAAAALEAGADDHLSKPYDLAELQARIHLGLRRVETVQQSPKPVGNGQDQLLQRILSRFLPLNRLAIGAVLADPELLGTPPVRSGRCDISEAVRATLEEAGRLLSSRVTVEASGPSLRAEVSGETFSQVLHNVLIHARLASADRPWKITVSWTREGSQAVVRCVDDGPQVLPEDAALLSWPVTTLRNQSLAPGFGIFFANLAAETAGGWLRCTALPGGGMETEIRFPATPE